MSAPKPILWALLSPAFRLSPTPLHGIRRRIWTLCGAKVAPTTKIRPSVRCDAPWNLAAGHLTIFGDAADLRCRDHAITVGDRCVVSQYTILATDITDPDQPAGIPDETNRLKGPITIEDDCWVAADSLVWPGTTIAAGTVVGARATVETDLPGWRVCVGQPARPLKERAFVPAAT
ncbi:MAG: colanic acid biosynthesis acetyltransferase WcaF [Planctomycetota bacterium]